MPWIPSNNNLAKVDAKGPKQSKAAVPSASYEVVTDAIREELKIKRHNFSKDFIFGAGTSAAQVST